MRQEKLWFVVCGMPAMLALVLMLPTSAWAASTYKVLHKFTGRDGTLPYAGLIQDGARNLYGTTVLGGNPPCSCGTVFRMHPNSDGSWTESVLYSFMGGADGVQPYAGLVFDAVGNLYGTTSRGGGSSDSGTVFKLTPNSDGSWTESVLYSFTGGGDGRSPYSALALDAAGNLYGTTPLGGSFGGNCGSIGCGVVFKLKPNSDGSWTESVLYSFTNSGDGDQPYAGLLFDHVGDLYGTTVFGNVFKLISNSDGTWTLHVLYTFKNGTDGSEPFGGLLFDATGNLFGTTAYGGLFGGICGVYGCGVVFKLHPKSDGTWAFTKPHTFAGMPALRPYAGMILDTAGSLYGTTAGPSFAKGSVVFKLTHSATGWAYTVLHTLQGKPALNPYASLVLDTAGNLYGTTEFCGSGYNCEGVVFGITP